MVPRVCQSRTPSITEGRMADLLECLIQIKALADTVDRLARLAHAAPPACRDRIAGAVVAMATLEDTLGAAIGAGAQLSVPGGNRDPGDASEAARTHPADALLDPFIRRRRASLARLQRCSAADLARVVPWPGRHGVTLADAVALVLAHDADTVGSLRRDVSGRETRAT
jgi:hypothetical protein